MHYSSNIKINVVKKYHIVLDKKPRTRAWLVSVFYLFCSIFSPAYERKLNTGCGKTSSIAFPNRQGDALPVLKWRTDKRSEYVSHIQSWGCSEGATPLYVY